MKSLSKVLLSSAILVSGVAFADTTWTFNSITAVTTSSVTTDVGGTSKTGDMAAGGATATAYANTVGSANINVELQGSGSSGLQLYTGGLGVINRDSATEGDSAEPEHAIDNQDRYEMVLVKFDNAVNLKSVAFGYVNGGSDFTVMAFQGSGSWDPSGKTWSKTQLATMGWNVVGTGSYTYYTNASGLVGTNMAINADGVSSSYWMIGAYNPLNGNAGGLQTTDYDHLKLKSVTGLDCTRGSCGGSQIPEPGSLALLGVGLLGLLRYRSTKVAS